MVASNIRELEGAYLQVLTQARAHGKDVTIEIAANVLGQTVKEKVNR
jgi:chromosomal replication initiation ATPase DnaA